MTTPVCLACRTIPSIDVDHEWTPLCSTCDDRLGTELIVGRRAVCRVGSIDGVVRRFDHATWADSGLAQLAHDDGTMGWYPLADLAPTP